MTTPPNHNTAEQPGADERAPTPLTNAIMRGRIFYANVGDLEREIIDHAKNMEREAIVLRELLAEANKSSAIVPPVVQAPIEPVRPDILEKLTYHAYQRDDLTLDDCLEYLCNQWKKIHGRTERAMVMQITELLASQPVAAPIVATVPSDLAEIIKIEARDLHHKLIEVFNMDDDAGSNWLARGYITGTIEACVEAAAPIRTATEQASDVRNDALEEAAAICDRNEFCNCCYEAADVAPNIAEAIRALKSSFPTAKGNAPAEVGK